MPRNKRQKIHPDRTTTAAYAASQPLFSALRNAITSLDTTKANLAVARDIVQSLHIKIANDVSHHDSSRHDAYMGAIVNAWISSTAVFCEVFEELAKVAAADPSEGREAGPRHEEFLGMFEMAKRAREMAVKFAPAEKEDKSDSASQDEGQGAAMEDPIHDLTEKLEPVPYVNGFGKRSMAESEEKAEKYQESPKGPSSISGDIRYNKTGDKILWEDDKLKVLYETLESKKKKARDILANRDKHSSRTQKQKQAKDGAQKASGAEEGESARSRVHEQPPAAPPNIEFEDVSAEVEARLKAKAEKKAAEKVRKTKKKRKRESGESCTFDAKKDVLGPLEALEQSIAEKPARKKTKNDTENQNRTGTPVNETSTTTTKARNKRKHSTPAPAVVSELQTGSAKKWKKSRN